MEVRLSLPSFPSGQVTQQSADGAGMGWGCGREEAHFVALNCCQFSF